MPAVGRPWPSNDNDDNDDYDLFTCTATAIPSTPAVWRTDLIFRRRRVLMISNHYDGQDGQDDQNDHDYHL